MRYQNLFIQPPVDKHLSCFQLLSFFKKAVVKSHAQIFTSHVSISPGERHRNGTSVSLGYTYMSDFIRNCQPSSPKL